MLGLGEVSGGATPRRVLWIACLLVVAGAWLVPARADEMHAGDIELEIVSGKLVTHNGRYFESAFSSTAPFVSAAPGFDSAPSLLVYDEEAEVAEEIGFTVLGPLLYWDGNELVEPQAGVELTLSFFGSSRTVSGADISGVTGFSLGGASPDGSFHEHFDFSLSAAANIGAYGVLLELTPAGASTFTKSDPFLIVFNRGLGSEEFEAGVHEMVEMTAVPEPSSVALAGVGIAGLIGASLRRRMRSQKAAS